MRLSERPLPAPPPPPPPRGRGRNPARAPRGSPGRRRERDRGSGPREAAGPARQSCLRGRGAGPVHRRSDPGTWLQFSATKVQPVRARGPLLEAGGLGVAAGSGRSPPPRLGSALTSGRGGVSTRAGEGRPGGPGGPRLSPPLLHLPPAAGGGPEPRSRGRRGAAGGRAASWPSNRCWRRRGAAGRAADGTQTARRGMSPGRPLAASPPAPLTPNKEQAGRRRVLRRPEEVGENCSAPPRSSAALTHPSLTRGPLLPQGFAETGGQSLWIEGRRDPSFQRFPTSMCSEAVSKKQK
jgi:hypothetical protein